jgi:serine/threonine protein kinase
MELLHEPGEIVAQRYRIVDTLGQGGSGTTYQAEDLQSGELVALKALSLHRVTDWKAIALFEREARVLAQLNHPGIPRYLDYFQVDTQEDRFFYIAQQLAPGQSLAELVQNGWRASPQDIRGIAIEILSILVYLHELNSPVIHRDIKPQNIIRREDGQVFLVDFGAVQDTYYNTFMRGSTVVGTYGYMAPEQFRGQAVPATDLYGLGATLLFLLTHHSPADLPTDDLKIDFRSRVQIAEEFADWLEKMLEPDAEDRFKSAKDALSTLRNKKAIASQPRSTFPWKAIIGLSSIAVATTAAVSVLNSHKWAVLGKLGFTPLGTLCENPHAFRSYLNQGGNPNVFVDVYDPSKNWVPYRSESLLECAANHGYKDIVELLIAKGVDIQTKGSEGQTLLHLVAQSPQLAESSENTKDLVKLLITKGVDVNAKNYWGKTPLHLAAYNGNKDVVALLIDRGADINAKDNSGKTPLNEAVLGYNNIDANKEVVALLLAKGADIQAKDKTGMTPHIRR